MMKAIPLTDEDPRSAVSAMVDVALLLLIFFLVATTIQPRERDLRMDLPPPGPAAVPFSPLRVEVRADGSVWWGEGAGAIEVGSPDEGELRRFGEMLEETVSGFGADRLSVLLFVEDGVRHQRFVDVLDTLDAMGVRHLAIAD